MRTTIDNPKVRAHHICPLCNGRKDTGLVACWPCFRTSGLKMGDQTAVRAVQEREAELSGIRRVMVGERPVKVAIEPDNRGASVDATVFLVSVWLGEMLDGGEIDGAAFHAMMQEVRIWADSARELVQ